MKVWILTDNLFWSARLLRSARSLGYEAVDARTDAVEVTAGDRVLLDLSAPVDGSLVSAWRASGASVIGFAGHKEQEKLEAGKAIGCDRVVSNSTITNRLVEVLKFEAARLNSDETFS